MISKEIAGYEGLYKISSIGEVWSLRKNKVMRSQVAHNGYPKVGLVKDKKIGSFFVHRLVANAFLDKPSAKYEVNHIDGVKTNNCLDNLEWVTRSQNIKHAIGIGIVFNDGYHGRKNKERNDIIYSEFLSGVKRKDLALKWKMTTAGIGQIINKIKAKAQ